MDAVGHLEIVLLLPAGIVNDDVLSALDDTDVDGQLHEGLVIHRAAAARHEHSVGHERAGGHVLELAALDEPDGVERCLGRRARRADRERENHQPQKRKQS